MARNGWRRPGARKNSAPRLAAWEAHSLSVLSDGRFEFGIGTGRPEVVEQAVRLLRRRDEIGMSYHSVNAAFAEKFAPVVELLAGR